MLDQPFWFFENFGALERGLSATMVTLSMLGMGATLTVRDFATTLFAWKGLAVGMAAQLLLVPAWAGLVMFVLGLFPEGFGGLTVAGAVGIATGLALVAAMPGGSVSNLVTFLGNGNVALSVSLTAITTFACLIATPIVLASLVMVRVPGDIEIDKSRIMLDIGLFLLAPLLAGMAFRAVTTLKQQLVFIKVMVRASLVLLALIIIGSLGAGRLQFEAYGWLGPATILVFCIGAVYMSRAFAHACGTAEQDSFAIVIEIAIKNGLLALLILTSMFPSHIMAAETGPHAQMITAARDGCIFVVLFFSGTGLVVGMLSAFRRRRRAARRS